jgi:hypothetical protein
MRGGASGSEGQVTTQTEITTGTALFITDPTHPLYRNRAIVVGVDTDTPLTLYYTRVAGVDFDVLLRRSDFDLWEGDV